MTTLGTNAQPDQQPAPQNPDADNERFLRKFHPIRLLLPVFLGLLAVAWLFYSSFDREQFDKIQWTGRTFAWIGLAFLLLLLRHWFYTLRMRVLTDGIFSWKKCLELIVLWEFSAALTPTSKGGPFVSLFILTKENLSAGRATAAVFYTMICDAGFFVLTLPLLLAWYGPNMLYPGATSIRTAGFAGGAFVVTYAMMATYWILLTALLLLKPEFAGRAILWLSKRRWLRRFSAKLEHLSTEFTVAAAEIRSQSWRYHLGVIGGTVGAWTSKFIMINCLIIAIVPQFPIDGATQAFIYARMVAMFIIMAFSPTPGGAGLAEAALPKFIADYVPEGMAVIVTLLWRGMAYYGYLIVGAIMAPAWINAKVRKKA